MGILAGLAFWPVESAAVCGGDAQQQEQQQPAAEAEATGGSSSRPQVQRPQPIYEPTYLRSNTEEDKLAAHSATAEKKRRQSEAWAGWLDRSFQHFRLEARGRVAAAEGRQPAPAWMVASQNS